MIIRISTWPGDILDDAVLAPRGLAVKVVDVSGEPLDGSGGSQDFVVATGPAFSAATHKAFLGNLKLLAKTMDSPKG